MLKTFIVPTLILCSAVQGSPISTGQQSTTSLRDALSERLLKYMNESADPCESFYEFACSNWRTHHPASESNPYTRTIDLTHKIFHEKVVQLLATPPSQTNTEAELKVKNFYESCLNFKSLFDWTDYEDKLIEILEEFGSMPALMGDEWQEQDFDWLKTVAEISHKYGINIILGYSIYGDEKDHTANYIELICENGKTLNSQDVEYNLVTFLGMSLEIAADVAQEIAEFGNLIATASLGGEGEISLDDMYTKYLPDLDIQRLFNISFGYLPTGGVIAEHCDVPAILDAVYQTPKEVVANYIAYKLLEPFMLSYPEDKSELVATCRSETLKYFPQIVSSMFYRASDLREKETYLEQMWQDVKSTLQMMLESSQLSWFDDVTREFALEKLHAMHMVVPLYKENDFDEEYGQLSMSQNDHLEILKSLRVLNAARTRASLELEPHHNDKNLDLYSAVYMYPSNSMVMPVTLLATDFSFSPIYPKAINFADLGFTLGHEAMHGFSAGGQEFNKLGNYVGNWGDDVNRSYNERRQCLYDQYHNYTYGGGPLPQDESQAENLADIVGILVAYETYRRWYEDSARTKEELALETLPNLNYTRQQLFFIAFAQVWCSDNYEETFEFASEDPHSPDKFRALVPLTNMGEFAKAFECPKGSAMNPEKQCSIN